ncbi:MAG: 50S ribosomal protein L1 [Gammaproteobacteria bacterium]|jgi:large subunit ribosomal protein L1|nr:50S ribosomal protein L1 [Gammaproteobacteria bacterium]MDA8954113.1 50S ribosomal protein L1 [Pseudomonadales bacterium]MBT5681710.1 50S ribosomal protein L1 [Gammaproteobacteria bacterium]MBT6026400.1 50S ribosomal protein L1 [Gammaproteobacteria bacterium]MBT6558982.1 50S ribosomal protein L1 [Gammaproteobacteria bacterium]|tara:strand:- start:808 stop:1503 length:696 start_codon:yes stop_codon:yes gene_type:complete
MAKVTKRMRLIAEKVDGDKAYEITEAVALLSDLSKTKFKESFDVSINLGVDPRKSDQVVRGATTLPHGTGKTVRVAVFAQGDNADKATAAGADLVGFEDLAEEVKAGKMDFDVVIATPDAMRIVGQLGKVLGPRGLMPNPKTGTVTPDVETAVKNAKAGQVQFRTDKAGIVHGSVGQVGFGVEEIKQNLEALMSDLKKAKPASAKGVYLKKVTLSTTMGPGVSIDQTSLEI